MANFDIDESLPTRDSHLHEVMTSQGEINLIKTFGAEDVHGSEDSKEFVAENNDGEQKPAVHRTLENGTNTSDSTDRTEVSEKSSENINELKTIHQSASETPNLDSLEPGEQEKVLDNNVEKKENSPNDTNQAEAEVSLSPADTNSSSKSIQETSTADHESGSHRSPNRESKAEYRKIKSEVTGEAETSESEGEEKDIKTNDQTEDTWMDILGNGLLKKRVIKTCYFKFLHNGQELVKRGYTQHMTAYFTGASDRQYQYHL